MEETQKSKRTTSHRFLKADISILVRVGHFYFGLTPWKTRLANFPEKGYIVRTREPGTYPLP